MTILARITDERVLDVRFDAASLIVDLMDGRTISAPLAWYPRLARATPDQRELWEKAGGGYGIHWPAIDEDLSTEGLLRGARAAVRGGGGMITFVSRAAVFVLITFLWWSTSAIAAFISAFPCGFGPDAACADPSAARIAFPIVAAVLGYGALVFLFVRRWSR